MAWIEGTEEQTFVVNRGYDEVANYFSDPAEFKRCLSDLESAEEVEPMVWRWQLKEKSEKGITFRADYTVAYKASDGEVEWETRQGNMRSEGVARFKKLSDERTEVNYRETIATDLPVARLLAKVFGPIVAREIRRGVGSFLDASREWLEHGSK